MSHDVCIDNAHSTCTLPGAVHAHSTARCTDGRQDVVLQLICIEKLLNDSRKMLQLPWLLPKLLGQRLQQLLQTLLMFPAEGSASMTGTAVR